MPVTTDSGWLVASHEGQPVARARIEQGATPDAVPPVDLDTARAATTHFPGHTSHPFPGCFVCGTGRAEGDGLRIFPGQVDHTSEGRTRIAATWTPAPEFEESAGSANLPITWAALDCIGGWAGDLTERMMVLGSMTGHVVRRPRIGIEHVLVAEARGEEGRKVSTGVSLYTCPTGGDPMLIASAAHTWITVDPSLFIDARRS